MFLYFDIYVFTHLFTLYFVCVVLGIQSRAFYMLVSTLPMSFSPKSLDFYDKGSLCNLGSSGTCYIKKEGLKFFIFLTLLSIC